MTDETDDAEASELNANEQMVRRALSEATSRAVASGAPFWISDDTLDRLVRLDAASGGEAK